MTGLDFNTKYDFYKIEKGSMKKLKLIILLLLLFTFPYVTIATDGPPDPGGNPQSEPPLGGGALIGSGLFILLGLGAAYGGKKLYDLRKEKLEE